MKSFLFPDVNVWLALTYEGHVHHRAAKAWFKSLDSDSQVFFCRITQLGLLRLLITESVTGKDEVMSQTEAWERYDQCLQDARVSFLSDPPDVEDSFRELSRKKRPAPKDWPESYLGAFATVSGLTLITFDRALRRRAGRAILLGA